MHTVTMRVVVGRGVFVLAVWVACFAVGCGKKGDERVGLTGTVSLQGKPLDRGNILFIPSTPGPTQTGAEIKDGAFSIIKEQGLVPGKYKVSISSPDGKTPDATSNQPPGPSGNFASKERIPPEFNTNSKEEIEVKADGPNQFEFKIP